MRGILCDVENMIFSCNLILAGCVLVAVVAQFTAKTTNCWKAIYFLSVMSCSIIKLSYVILHVKTLCFPILHGKKFFTLGNDGAGGGGGGGLVAYYAPPFLYGPEYLLDNRLLVNAQSL